MANIKRYLKLVYEPTGDNIEIKLARIQLTDPVEHRFTILEQGENLTALADKYFTYSEAYKQYTTGNFKIVGTNNYFSFLGYKDSTYTNTMVYTARGTFSVKNGDVTQGQNFWSSGFCRPMLGYEENYNLFFPCEYFDSFQPSPTDSTKLIYDFFGRPYTPPNADIYDPSTQKRIKSCAGRTAAREFLDLCDAINNNTLDTLSSQINTFYNMLKNYKDNPETGEPTVSPFDIEYGFPGEPSGPQGGDGEMKDTNEPVALSPSDITNVAYPVRCYRLSRANVSALHGYLWSNDFITNLPKLFSDPFSAIVGIQAIPYISPVEESNIIIGTLDTNIVANKVTLYYVTVDLGSIDVAEYWQNFLDYQPYTRLKLFLPYIGIVDLPTDLFMNNSVAVKYRIDIVSGACVAIVSNRENIICTFTGNCSTKIPLSNNDHSNAIGNTLVGIAGLAGSVATGNAVGAVANTASIVAGLKERIQISGSLSTAHGILINDKPFIMIERPDTEIPENYARLKGYTSNISMNLSETTGFTKISDIKLDGLSCTDAEKEELLNMMQNGIYL